MKHNMQTLFPSGDLTSATEIAQLGEIIGCPCPFGGGWDEFGADGGGSANDRLAARHAVVEHVRLARDDTPIHDAAFRGQLYVLKRLVEQGAGVVVNTPTGYGNVPIHGAAWNGHVEAIRFLVEQGADVHATDHNGETALSAARRRQHTAVVRFIETIATDQPETKKLA